MIEDLINRIKGMYHQLEQDEMRQDRKLRENWLFGVPPPLNVGAAPPSGPLDGPSPPPVVPPGPVAAPLTTGGESMLDMIGRSRGGI